MVQNLGDKRIEFQRFEMIVETIALYGNTVVNYIYDSWGKVLSITGSLGKNMYAYCKSG